MDPGRCIVVVNQTNLAFEVKLIRREQWEQERRLGIDAEYAPQAGTPYVMRRRPLVSPWKLPCSPPPWGTLAAVDAHSGKLLWRVPLGTIRDLTPLPLLLTWGVPNLGGPITTASGVTFIGAALDHYLRAFDTATGRELWKTRLPASAQSTPMTYRARQGGRQFVVVSAGGHAKAGNKLGDSLVAFALP